MKKFTSIADAFIDEANLNANRIAVKYWQDKRWESLTYNELKQQALSISAWLINEGVCPGDAVVLPSRRSPSLCAQLLGILLSGAHYVFIDDDYPLARQKLICKEVGASLGIYADTPPSSTGLPIRWCEVPSSFPESGKTVKVDAEQAAYVMFTSGSTGNPKGVVVPHRAVCRLVLNTDYISFDEKQIFLQISALSFDASTLEIWGPLLNGGTCVIYPEEAMIDPQSIAEVIQHCGITTAWLTSSLYNTIIATQAKCLEDLKQLLIGGEALSVPHVLKGLKALPNTRIFNGYGPTENTTFTTVYPIPRDLPDTTRRIPIGYPINGTHCEVFDENLQVIEDNSAGELVAFGSGLALRYLNQPELTKERFVKLKCADGQTRLGYRTGDLVRQLADGSFDYIERNDKQVKIDGHRIEPAEIEFCLNQLAQVSEARVLVRTGPKGQKRIAAYIVGISQEQSSNIRALLVKSLPSFMVPHFIIAIPELPKNQNGKLDEAKLPDPFQVELNANNSNTNARVARCWQQILNRTVAESDNFQDAGGTSLEALQLAELLEQVFKRDLGPMFVFEHTSIAAQIRFFDSSNENQHAFDVKSSASSQAVAVIGMSCRFPGADNANEFWDNLLAGKESIRFFSNDELSDEVNLADRENPNYVAAKGLINNCAQFDAEFFGISPTEAAIMDPQQRIMLQLAWHAMEDANAVPGESSIRTGVFVGSNWARYYQQYVLNNEDIKTKFGQFNASLANEADFLSTRISYKLNLTGPSLNIFTACSTGLVAIAQACSSIEQGECEMALAGGVSVSTPVNSGYVYQEGGMLSSDGHCRPFDSQASGTTFNDGAGMVLLKRLDLAERDGDNIYAVVKGYGVNNDGENKASFTAPSITGQVSVYQQALNKAGLAPDSIGFIETHGTATPLGDPIEVKALAQVYTANNNDSEKDKQYSKTCALGSVKSNIGHTIHAAGLAGFIKTVKTVETGKIPATLFFSKANPKLNIEASPFYVNNELVPWKQADQTRRAAVSSLGVGGTNAHIIIEQYSKPEDSLHKQAELKERNQVHPYYSILISARNRAMLNAQVERYQQYFAKKTNAADISSDAYTSFIGRKSWPYRVAVSGLNAGDIANQLKNSKNWQEGHATSKDKKLGFMFSGQGSQRHLMGYWLYQNSQLFKNLFDQASQIILEEQGFDLHSALFSDDKKTAVDSLNQTKIAQPALFVFEYGLARYLEQCGCHADFYIGHSIGEFTAAALAGIFTFEQAVSIVAARGSLMQAQAPGKMLSVNAKLTQVEALLNDELCLAAVNAPDRLVLSGTDQAIQKTVNTLSAQEIPASVLHTSHAFHSHMMEPVVAKLEKLIASMTLNPPEKLIFSTATGEILAEQAMQASYWANQLRSPVLFADAVKHARDHFNEQQLAFVEVGPGHTLTSLVACQNAETGNKIIPAAINFAASESTASDISTCLNRLWTDGFSIDWTKHFDGKPITRTRLPTYVFSPEKHWLTTNTEKQPFNTIADMSLTQQPITQEITMSSNEHLQSIEQQLRGLLEDVTGFDLGDVSISHHFSEIGLDSLLLTQAATTIERTFPVGLTFRHLMEDYTSIEELRDYIAEQIPPATNQVPVEARPISDSSTMSSMVQPLNGESGPVQQLIQQQLQVMQLQLQALGGAQVTIPSEASSVVTTASATEQTNNATEDSKPSKPRHTPGTRITREKLGVNLTQAQQQWIDSVLQAYQKKFASSKSITQKHRKQLADPRSVSGFNPEWKEIIFPIVTERSKGSKLWDIDGNELIDTSNGFGPILFGHSPDFVTEAVKKQLDLGIETGPQSPLAGEVAQLFCELTGNERCTFASTGSEAVLGAIRLARTVTGRNKVAMFEGSYHGIFDEVINRSGKDYQALPAAPGIPFDSTSNMFILPWGDPQSLETLKSLSPDLAAVLIEPVQSRKPEFHDQEYLQAIREITNESDTAMILDEVVTGFRVAPGGIREHFNIDADLATYGKVVGGGYPIGVMGGKAKFMDALDGGYWEYGDDSIPEAGVTFFAGTFVRHPVALAAAKAILEKIKAEGDDLYAKLALTTTGMANEAKTFIKEMECEAKFEEFASFFYVSVPTNAHWGHLLFTLMTYEGIHMQQYRPNFLTTEHSPSDVAAIIAAFKKSLAQMISYGLIEGDMVAANGFLSAKPVIPEGARLGKNAKGEPAYFIEDPNNKGKYIEVEVK